MRNQTPEEPHLGRIVDALLAVVIVLSWFRSQPLLTVVPLALVLLMSAVPVALPAMFTVSTAVGSRELAKRGVLVTHLSATEDAATMDVLCVDEEEPAHNLGHYHFDSQLWARLPHQFRRSSE